RAPPGRGPGRRSRLPRKRARPFASAREPDRMKANRLRLPACLVGATVTAAACGGASATAPTATASPLAQVPGASRVASDYVNELVNTMQQNSINRGRIDWADFRSQVFQRASGAQTIVDLY